MATAAEKLAGNLNFGALGRATELRNRLLFTLGAVSYTHLTLPTKA